MLKREKKKEREDRKGEEETRSDMSTPPVQDRWRASDPHGQHGWLLVKIFLPPSIIKIRSRKIYKIERS